MHACVWFAVMCMLVLSILSIVNFNAICFLVSFRLDFRFVDVLFSCDSPNSSISVWAIVCNHDFFYWIKKKLRLFSSLPIQSTLWTEWIKLNGLRLDYWIEIFLLCFLFHLRLMPRWHLIWHLQNDQTEYEFTFRKKLDYFHMGWA